MIRFLFFVMGLLFCTVGQAKPFLGYGMTNTVTSIQSQERAYMGFKTGFDMTIKKKLDPDFIVRESLFGAGSLSAVKVAEKLHKQGVQVFLGFPTSHEAFLVSEYAHKKGLMAFFSAAGIMKLAQMGDQVFTMAESPEESLKDRFDFIRKQFPRKKGVALFAAHKVFSFAQFATFERLLKTPEYKDLELSLVKVNASGQVSEDILEKLKNGEFQYMYLTMYAKDAVPVFEQLEKVKVDLPIVASSSWDFQNIDVVRRFLMARKSPAYTYTIWDDKKPDAQKFLKDIKTVYQARPSGGMAYGYDLGVVVATVLNRIEGPVSLAKFKKAFQKDPCFDGTIAGRICFDPKGGHAQRPIFPYQFHGRSHSSQPSL